MSQLFCHEISKHWMLYRCDWGPQTSADVIGSDAEGSGSRCSFSHMSQIIKLLIVGCFAHSTRMIQIRSNMELKSPTRSRTLS